MWQSIGIACGDDKPVAMWFFTEEPQRNEATLCLYII